MSKLRFVYTDAINRPYNRCEQNDNHTRDYSFVVFNGNNVIHASEAERHTKVKHDCASVLGKENMLLNFKFYAPDALENLYAPMSTAFNTSIDATSDCTPPPNATSASNTPPSTANFPTAQLEEFMGDIVERPGDHHLNHIYEAFYQSGFHEAAVLVNDCNGTKNDCITCAYMKEGAAPVILKRFSDKNSPCRVYSEASIAAFGAPNSEGKLMGLAAYGQDCGLQYISWDNNEHTIYANKKLARKDIKHCMRSNNHSVMAARDIAYTIQKDFEDVMVEVVKNFTELLEQAGIHTENLCMSGGGVLNCPANSCIVDLGLFKHYWASPQPSDGCAESIGRAFRNMEALGENLHSHRLANSYLGVSYPLTEFKQELKPLTCAIDVLSEHLKSGGVIAWYQGGAEYGPRALGHRSFLADPSNPEMLETLNNIKGREMWRPLAPVVPEELFNRVFDVENTDMCEFMLRTLTVKEKWKSRMCAVCHADNTTRPQLLRKKTNPELYALLMGYFERRGVPCLINTSLNINGFPIVETPHDLYDLQEEILYTKYASKVKTIAACKGTFYEVSFPERTIQIATEQASNQA